ncbi:hypothetical protein BDZ91DRAFT_722755 [Kalaharituber pfeilii]|nr:hypothetical protein BDZ91DRAFT_722755 [Kalaharituber pfeilii]
MTDRDCSLVSLIFFFLLYFFPLFFASKVAWSGGACACNFSNWMVYLLVLYAKTIALCFCHEVNGRACREQREGKIELGAVGGRPAAWLVC